MSVMADIHALIRSFRNRLNESQPAFALRVGVSASSIAHYENGDQSPKPAVLRRLVQEAQAVGDTAFLDGVKQWTGGFTEEALKSVQRQREVDFRPRVKALARNLDALAAKVDEIMLHAPEEAASEKLADSYVVALGRLGDLLRAESARFSDLIKLEGKVRESYRMAAR